MPPPWRLVWESAELRRVNEHSAWLVVAEWAERFAVFELVEARRSLESLQAVAVAESAEQRALVELPEIRALLEWPVGLLAAEVAHLTVVSQPGGSASIDERTEDRLARN
jgi:hypothetical protein